MTYTRQCFRIRKARVDKRGFCPTHRVLDEYVRSKYGDPEEMGPSPRLRYELGYASADDVYESLISGLIDDTTRWLDVGCGRDIFPSNREGAKALAKRAAYLAGVDPDDNVNENNLLDERFQGPVELYRTPQQFSLVTLRMVAEHVQQAERCVEKLAELTSKGGLVVIYTPWKWAPMSLAASVVPFRLHNRLKRLIWDSEERDTFPTAYRMNTRKDLRRLFTTYGFDEVYYCHVDDCSVLTRFASLNWMEIQIRNVLCRAKLPYPEFCILAVYERV